MESKVKRVMAASQRRHSRNLEDLVTVLVEMENGVLGALDVSKVSRGGP